MSNPFDIETIVDFEGDLVMPQLDLSCSWLNADTSNLYGTKIEDQPLFNAKFIEQNPFKICGETDEDRIDPAKI